MGEYRHETDLFGNEVTHGPDRETYYHSQDIFGNDVTYGSNGDTYYHSQDIFGNDVTYGSNGDTYYHSQDIFGNDVTYGSNGDTYYHTEDIFGNRVTYGPDKDTYNSDLDSNTYGSYSGTGTSYVGTSGGYSGGYSYTNSGSHSNNKPSLPPKTQPIKREKRNKKIGLLFYLLGWAAFIYSVVFVLSPFVDNWSIHFDEATFNCIDFQTTMTVTMAGVCLLCFGGNMKSAPDGSGSSVIAVIWWIIIFVSDVTVNLVNTSRYPKMFNEAVKSQIIKFAVFVLLIRICSWLGQIIGSKPIAGQKKTKRKICIKLSEALKLLLLVVCTAICVCINCNVRFFYECIGKYNLIYVPLYGIPIFLMIYGNMFRRECLDCWYRTSICAFFSCIILSLGYIGGSTLGIGWFALAIIALIYNFSVMSATSANYSYDTIDGLSFCMFFLIFIIDGYFALKYANGEGLPINTYEKIFLVAPIAVLMSSSTKHTLDDVIR